MCVIVYLLVKELLQHTWLKRYIRYVIQGTGTYNHRQSTVQVCGELRFRCCTFHRVSGAQHGIIVYEYQSWKNLWVMPVMPSQGRSNTCKFALSEFRCTYLEARSIEAGKSLQILMA